MTLQISIFNVIFHCLITLFLIILYTPTGNSKVPHNFSISKCKNKYRVDVIKDYYDTIYYN